MGEQLLDAPGDHGAGKPLGLRVDSFQGGGCDLSGGAHLGVDHLAAQHTTGKQALKEIFLPDLQFLDCIGVIEPGDLQGGYAVARRQPFHLPAAGQHTSPQFCIHLCLDDTFGLSGGLCNGVGLCKIHIPTWVVAQEIGQSQDAQLFKALSGLGADPFQIAHRSIRCKGRAVLLRHGRGLLSGGDGAIVARWRCGCNKTYSISGIITIPVINWL